MLRFDRIPIWAGVIISVLIGVGVGLVVWIFVIPRVKRSLGIAGETSDESVNTREGGSVSNVRA